MTIDSQLPDLTSVEAKHREWIRAPREKVYDAFATTEGLNAWFTQGGSVDAQPGGAMRFKWRDWGPDKGSYEAPGRVIEAKRPERFVFRWGEEGKDATTVELTFEERDGGTLVQVREYGFVKLDTALGNSSGWGEALTLVKFWVEHGISVHGQR